MKFSERLRLRRNRPRATTDAQPPVAEETSAVDRRPPAALAPTTISTAMVCPNCEGRLRVERLDMVARTAEMRCADCGFAFGHRLPANQ